MIETNSTNGTNESPALSTKRIPSNVSGFDTILTGGIISGTTNLISGAAGTGKTILTQQLAFNFLKQGNNALCLSLLSESHEKMLTNLSNFSFFDQQMIGTKIHYLSLYHEIASGGLEKLVTTARTAVLKHKAKFVLLDGVSTIRDFAQSRGELHKTLFDFNAQLSALGCTVFLLVDDEMPVYNAPEYRISDTIIRLYNKTSSMRGVRSLEIIKSRATFSLGGQHYFDITSDGIVIYPRLEALMEDGKLFPPPPIQQLRSLFGIEGLDQMLAGGLLTGSISVLLGTPGSGKTLTGLHFIHEGVRQNEKCLILSFQQSAEQLITKSRLLGYDLAPYIENGTLKIIWELPVERYLDEVAGKLLKIIENHKPERLFIDSMSDLESLSLYPDRLKSFWAVFTNFLRNHKLTTVGSMDLHQIVGTTLKIPEKPISIIADTIVLLRSLEIGGQLKHLISVLEMRDSDYDINVREYLISRDGLRVGEAFKGAESVLSGTARRQTRFKRLSV